MSIEIKNRFTGELIRTIDAADLRYADLRDADLRDADLCYANLRAADLRYANLRYANLHYADLRYANLHYASLRDADLCDADLRDADLCDADLRDADLRDANLCDADLRAADLRYAKNAERAVAMTRILPDGDLIGWKKCCNGVIVKLRIPAEAKRSHAFGRKCRAEFADVLEVVGAEKALTTGFWPTTEYVAGRRVLPDAFDEDWMNECSHGIHFFITRAEAEAY